MQLARVVGAAIGVVATIATTTLVMALPASAHTPTLTPKCENGTASLTVKLRAYAQSTDQKSNHIKVTVDGKEVENKDFSASFDGAYSATGDVKREFVVEVTAYDGNQFSFKKTETVEPCVAVTSTSSTTTTTTTTSTTVETTTTTTEATTTTTEPTTSESSPAGTTTTTTTTPAIVAVADTGGLADTGASIAIPLVIGVVLLGGGAALLIVLRRRAAGNQ
ncbi:hypothetical protein [Saccharothrix deserti]|uniref:hypothetical protein n=1 Tax=Saccharothrix deserti TaxID=2593674 RepID=UPI00131AE666|nr:hypothetical protein [Saccharothrix deserti]